MNEKQQNILRNSAILHVAPEVLKINAIFSDLTRGLGSIFEEIAIAFTGEEPKLSIDHEFDDFFKDVLSQVYQSLPEITEQLANIINSEGYENLLEQAQIQCEELNSEHPSLPALDKTLTQTEIMTLTALLQANDPRVEKLAHLVDSFKPVFDFMQQQINQEEQFKQSIFSSSETGDIKAIQKYVDADLNLFATNDRNLTGLDIAIKNRQNEVIKYFLDNADDYELKSIVNQTSIQFAVENNDTQTYLQLIDYAKGQISQIDFERIAEKSLNNDNITIASEILKHVDEIPESLVRKTIDNRSHQLMQALLDAGLDVNFKIFSDPLITKAIDNDDLEMAELLIKGGAETDFADFFGRSLLFKAIDDDKVELTDLLIKYDASVKHESPQNVLNIANKYLKKYQITIQEAIARLNIDLKLNLGERGSFLHLAVRNSDAELIKLLIANDIDINSLFGSHNILESIEDKEILTLLIDNGLNIDHVDDSGQPVIFDLMTSYYKDILEILVARRINLDVNSSQGEHLLHYVIGRFPEFVKPILDSGVNPDVLNKDGFTCVQDKIHFYNMFSEVIDDFIDAGANFNLLTSKGFPIVHVLCASYDADTVENAITKLKPDMTIEGSNGHDSFFHATYSRNIEVLKILSKWGMDSNKKSKSQVTPLSIAINRNDLGLVKTLVEDCHADTKLKFIGLYDATELAKKLERSSIVEYFS